MANRRFQGTRESRFPGGMTAAIFAFGNVLKHFLVEVDSHNQCFTSLKPEVWRKFLAYFFKRGSLVA